MKRVTKSVGPEIVCALVFQNRDRMNRKRKFYAQIRLKILQNGTLDGVFKQAQYGEN